MVNRQHIIIDIWDLNSSIRDSMLLINFLNQAARIMAAKVVQTPVIAQREGKHPGLTGVIVTEIGHIIINMFPGQAEATIAVQYYEMFDILKLRDFIIDFFDVNLRSIQLTDASKMPTESIQCEEPDCTRKAVKEYRGRKVCQNHYQAYKEKEWDLTTGGD